MPCMCGDVMCSSCGPAQGYNPAFEAVAEWMQEVVLADFPVGFDVAWLAEDLANRLADAGLQEAMESAAAVWARNNYETTKKRAAR